MSIRKSVKRRASAVAIVVVAATVAACGSDDKTSDAPTATAAAATVAPTHATTAATTAGTTATPQTADDPATGEAVKIMVIAPTDNALYVVEELPVAVKAAGEYVNEKGLAGGHEIEVIYCNDKNDPNEGAQCAQKAVDEGVVAVVGSASLNMSASIIPTLEENNIALINAQIYGPLESSSPISFQMTGQFLAGFSAVGDVLATRAAKTAVFMRSSSESGAAVHEAIRNSLKDNGVELTEEIAMPIDTVDPTSYVQQAIDKEADAIVVIPAAAQTAQIIDGLRSAGLDFSETVVISYSSIVNELTMIQLGADGFDGILTLATYAPPSDPALADFGAGMDKADPDHELTRTETSPGAWASVLVVAKVVAAMEGDITAESFLAALNASDPIDVGLALPPFDPKATNTDRPEFVRVGNDRVYLYELKEGEFVTADPAFIEHAFETS